MPLISPLPLAAIKSSLEKICRPAEDALKAELQSHVPFIEDVAAHILFSAGKRLRPALFLLIASLLGRPAPAKLAAIFEYLHAASLLHDDVVDSAGLRRGLPAAHVKYGNPEVILVGDFLFSKSYSLAATAGLPAFSAALADCTTSMAEGQVLELLHTGDLMLSEENYLRIITAKTADLIACACKTAAIYAGAAEGVVELMAQYGLNLGIAFQIVDDALDYAGTEEEFGKQVGHDLLEGKITLPFIRARDQAAANERARLLSLAGAARTSEGARAEAQALVTSLGGVEAALKAARQGAESAQAVLRAAELPSGPDLDLLYSLAAYVVERRQ